MKKFYISILILLMSTFCACGSKKFSISKPEISTELSIKLATTLTTSPSASAAQILKGGMYENKELGFQITFPNSWKNYYVINWQGYFTDNSVKECIRICFYGESEPSRSYDDDITGVPMFYICTENYLKNRGGGVAAVKKIGQVGDQSFYKFSQTDYPLDVLNPDFWSDTYTSIELDKVKRDYKKAKEMEKDIDLILKTFAAC